MALSVSVLALMAALLSALYSRWTSVQARRAKDIGRLNALLAFRKHYLDLMDAQANAAQVHIASPLMASAARSAYDSLDEKLRDINAEIMIVLLAVKFEMRLQHTTFFTGSQFVERAW